MKLHEVEVHTVAHLPGAVSRYAPDVIWLVASSATAVIVAFRGANPFTQVPFTTHADVVHSIWPHITYASGIRADSAEPFAVRSEEMDVPRSRLPDYAIRGCRSADARIFRQPGRSVQAWGRFWTASIGESGSRSAATGSAYAAFRQARHVHIHLQSTDSQVCRGMFGLSGGGTLQPSHRGKQASGQSSSNDLAAMFALECVRNNTDRKNISKYAKLLAALDGLASASRPLYLTGHSLGGAMATLFAMGLHTRLMPHCHQSLQLALGLLSHLSAVSCCRRRFFTVWTVLLSVCVSCRSS